MDPFRHAHGHSSVLHPHSISGGVSGSGLGAALNATAAPSVGDGIGDHTLVAKVTAMAVLGLASLTLGLVPLKLAVWLGWDRNAQRKPASAAGAAEALHSHGSQSGGGGALLSALLCFGGGVLMCTTFVHMLPEVTEAFTELEEDGAVTGSLVHTAPHLLMCAGFFIMYLVEELVHMYLHWRSHKHGHKHGHDGHAHGDHEHALGAGHAHNPVIHNNLTAAATACDAEDVKKSPIKAVKWSARECKPSTVVLEYADGTEVKSEVPTEFLVSAVTFSTPWGLQQAAAAEKQYLRVDAERPCRKGVPRLRRMSALCHKMHHDHTLEPELVSANLPDFMAGANHHSHAIPVSGAAETDADGGDDAVVSALRGLLIVLALSVHELFEGLAVGLEGSTSNVWYMLMAVACHKLVIAFCIGVELVAMRTKMPLHVLYVATFALVSPLGIGVGILVTESYSGVEGGIVPAFLQGLASGTLLYVVFFEILERQRACGHSGLRQYLAVLLGFLVMFGLTFIGGHEHHHHHHESEEAVHALSNQNYTVLHTE
ncbi:Zinc transporter ZIP1 [Frankliniella fusca]|uniref:Zinc transporter ZIP1 n=1 Tax=Frankliniella fusca TaxID=407009 RepID=A0AAE1GUD8_9NEOP|nr:Zinc transporter ZIP1 [Frankliniella fusca]